MPKNSGRGELRVTLGGRISANASAVTESRVWGHPIDSPGHSAFRRVAVASQIQCNILVHGLARIGHLAQTDRVSSRRVLRSNTEVVSGVAKRHVGSS